MKRQHAERTVAVLLQGKTKIVPVNWQMDLVDTENFYEDEYAARNMKLTRLPRAGWIRAADHVQSLRSEIDGPELRMECSCGWSVVSRHSPMKSLELLHAAHLVEVQAELVRSGKARR